MEYYRDFVYNPDFEWHETEIFWGNERIKLLVPDYITDDFPDLHAQFVRIIKWIEHQRATIQKQCLVRLFGFVPPDYKAHELKLNSISLEKHHCFELLWQHIAVQGFVALVFNKNFEIAYYQIHT